LELRELHARTLSEMRGSISSLTTKYKSTLEAMETLKRESEENRRLSAMAANSAQIHCDEIKNGLQAMSLDANELVQILSTELSSVKEERDKLRRNQDVLCSKLSSMSQPGVEERAVLVGEIQDLTRSRETLQVSISNLRTKCSDLEAIVASLQEENARLLQREATDAPAVDDLRTKCSDLEATVASLQEENAHLLQREATDAPAVDGLRTKCSDLEATVASLQEENARLLKAQSKSHHSSVEKLLRLTRENQHFAVKLSEQENKSKALESTIMLLNKYLDRDINTGGVENSLIDILDDISYIKRTTNSREAKELIGMTEKGLERINEPRFHDSGHPVLPQT
jgi:DNA repair exonuclease SbcCD ATPase subunit